MRQCYARLKKRKRPLPLESECENGRTHSPSPYRVEQQFLPLCSPEPQPNPSQFHLLPFHAPRPTTTTELGRLGHVMEQGQSHIPHLPHLFFTNGVPLTAPAFQSGHRTEVERGLPFFHHDTHLPERNRPSSVESGWTTTNGHSYAPSSSSWSTSSDGGSDNAGGPESSPLLPTTSTTSLPQPPFLDLRPPCHRSTSAQHTGLWPVNPSAPYGLGYAQFEGNMHYPLTSSPVPSFVPHFHPASFAPTPSNRPLSLPITQHPYLQYPQQEYHPPPPRPALRRTKAPVSE